MNTLHGHLVPVKRTAWAAPIEPPWVKKPGRKLRAKTENAYRSLARFGQEFWLGLRDGGAFPKVWTEVLEVLTEKEEQA